MRAVKNVVAILLGLALLCSCSVKRHLARVEGDVKKMYAGTRNWEELPLRTITWAQALSMLPKNNLQILEAEDAIRQAERDSLSVYTEMIPGVSYYGYITRTISELANPMSADEMSSSINVTFSIPALTQVPYRVYSAKVRTIAAMKAKEGRYREAVSRLYKLVREREIDMRRRDLVDHAPQDTSTNLRNLAKEYADRDEQYWSEVARLIGRRDARWKIIPESMPHIKWSEYEKRLDRLSELVVCQFAMRLEQSRMAQYSVALSYLPTINTGIYSPSLFSSSGGMYNGAFLDKDDTRINLSISYSVDTELYNWDTYKRSKERYEWEKIKVADELMNHRSRMQKLRASMDEYHNWRNFMLKNIAYLSNSTPLTADELIGRSQNIHNMRLELLDQEKKSVESEAAVVLEYGMPDELGR